MHATDFQRFNAIIAGMAKVYERAVDQVLLDAYWVSLRDWSLEEFEKGAAVLMRTSKFMPRPADFNELRKAALPTVGEAWAAVLHHCKGGYRDGQGISPQIDAAVRPLGGYRTLAMLPLEDMHWQEKRFSEHYEDAIEAQERRDPFTLDVDARTLLSGARSNEG